MTKKKSPRQEATEIGEAIAKALQPLVEQGYLKQIILDKTEINKLPDKVDKV